MLYDSIGLMTVSALPEAPASDVAKIVYLDTQDGTYQPGLYLGVNSSWAPVGSGDPGAGGGASVQTLIYDSGTTPAMDIGTDVGSGLILSAVVRRNVQADVHMEFKEKATGTVLETVRITKEYTAIVIPQPYSLYRLEAPAGLEITVKFI